MKQYIYRAIIKDTKIESNNIDVLVHDINTRIGFPIVSRDSVFNYFNRPERSYTNEKEKRNCCNNTPKTYPPKTSNVTTKHEKV